MRNILFAAVAASALFAGTAAMADEFNGQPQTQAGVSAYLNQQATNAQLSDPTAPDSIRSHGHP